MNRVRAKTRGSIGRRWYAMRMRVVDGLGRLASARVVTPEPVVDEPASYCWSTARSSIKVSDDQVAVTLAFVGGHEPDCHLDVHHGRLLSIELPRPDRQGQSPVDVFRRTIPLPADVVSDRAGVRFENAALILTLERSKASPPGDGGSLPPLATRKHYRSFKHHDHTGRYDVTGLAQAR